MNDKYSKSKKLNRLIIIILLAVMGFNVILLFSLTHTIKNMRKLNNIIINNKYDASKTKSPAKPVIVYKDKIIYKDKVVKEKCDVPHDVDVVDSIINDGDNSIHGYDYYHSKLSKVFYIVYYKLQRKIEHTPKTSILMKKLNEYSDSFNLIEIDIKNKVPRSDIKNDIKIVSSVNKALNR